MSIRRAAFWILFLISILYSAFITIVFGAFYTAWYMESVKAQKLTFEYIKGRALPMELVENQKGLLSSREVGRDFIEAYLRLPALAKLDENSNEKIVVYSFIGSFFTVVYNSEDEVISVIDNGV